MKSLRYLVVILIVASFVIANFSSGKALTSALVDVPNFGTNPTNLRMSVYIPTTVKPNPPILVVVHWCGGSAEAIYAGTQYAALADQYGYIIVYPSTTNFGSCFDVSSPQALTHGGGSDPVAIMSMVTYAAQHYNGDLNQVYVTGISSGAMMTNVLLGDYPDVFKAGAAFAGVPFGCMATTDGTVWNSTCPPGQMIKTPQEWGDIVRAAYPGYNGPRPRMQLWHGTDDTALAYPNFGEEIKQWTNVLGASQTPTSTDNPRPTWTRTRYANSAGAVVVEAISEQGVTHSIVVDEAAALHFFGLDGSITPTPSITPGGPTLTRTNTPTITRTNTPAPPTNTPTITATPCTSCALTVQINKGNGIDNTQETGFNFLLKNTSASAVSNLSTRIYFDTDGSNAGSGYVLEKYYDQSGVATYSGPTLACGSTYYFTVTYGIASLPAGGQWEIQTALHLSSWASTYSGANDFYHGGYAVGALPVNYTSTGNIPAYISGALTSGSTPNCGSPTNTPVPATATRTNTPVSATVTNTPVAPTATRTNTSVPSTPTNTPIGPTNTPVPPTATRTNTPIGPTATRTNTSLPPTATRTNTPIGPTNTPGGSDPCASPTVITAGGSFAIATTATCFKYVNAANKWGGMFTVMNGSSTAANTLKWYGGRSETVTACINDSQVLSGNGAQLNNFTVSKDSTGAMYLIVTGTAANTVSLSIQNWQNGTGCSAAPTPHP